MCSTDSLKVEVVYEKPFRITDRGHKQEVENEERKFLQVRVSHSVEGDLLITDDLHQLKDFLHVIGVRIGSVYTEMNYETDDTLLGIFIYNPIKPVIFKEYKVGGINKLSKSNTEVTGVSGSEFIACYVDNSDLVTTIYKPKLNTENDKVEMRKHFIDRPVSTHSFILFSKEKDYIFEGKPSHKFEFICTDVAEEGELENYNSSSETEDFLTYIVKTLTQRRIAYRLTQQELADRVGLKQSAIARFEASAHTFTYPRLSTVELIATGLGMNLVLFKENEDEVGGKE